jgi:hypothetical protein
LEFKQSVSILKKLIKKTSTGALVSLTRILFRVQENVNGSAFAQYLPKLQLSKRESEASTRSGKLSHKCSSTSHSKAVGICIFDDNSIKWVHTGRWISVDLIRVFHIIALQYSAILDPRPVDHPWPSGIYSIAWSSKSTYPMDPGFAQQRCCTTCVKL